MDKSNGCLSSAHKDDTDKDGNPLAGYFWVIHLSYAVVAQLVAHDLAKVGVAGPNPVYRSQT